MQNKILSYLKKREKETSIQALLAALGKSPKQMDKIGEEVLIMAQEDILNVRIKKRSVWISPATTKDKKPVEKDSHYRRVPRTKNNSLLNVNHNKEPILALDVINIQNKVKFLLKGKTGYFSHKYDNRGRLYPTSVDNRETYVGDSKAKLNCLPARQHTILKSEERDENNNFTAYEELILYAASFTSVEGSEEEILKKIKNLETFPEFTKNNKKLPLYKKAVDLIHKINVEGKIKTNFLVGKDMSASGIQIMSLLTKCPTGLKNCGNDDKPSSPYKKVWEEMNANMKSDTHTPYEKIKKAVMVAYYGSKAEPRKILSKEELTEFDKALKTVSPGAYELLEDLRNSWNRQGEYHSWYLPDGHQAYVPVFGTEQIEFTWEEIPFPVVLNRTVIQPTNKSVSLIANVVQSIEGYIAREMIRRCSGNTNFREKRLKKLKILKGLNLDRNYDLEYSNAKKLNFSPFTVITIFDEYKCTPSDIKHMKMVYNQIVQEILQSNILKNIFDDLGVKYKYTDFEKTEVKKKNHLLS